MIEIETLKAEAVVISIGSVCNRIDKMSLDVGTITLDDLKKVHETLSLVGAVLLQHILEQTGKRVDELGRDL